MAAEMTAFSIDEVRGTPFPCYLPALERAGTVAYAGGARPLSSI
jgi:hypothetical protein